MSEAQIRSVSVRLDMDIASYLAKAELATKATDQLGKGGTKNLGGLNTELGKTSTELDKTTTAAKRTETGLRGVDQRVQSTSRSFEQGSRSIDKYSGRLGILLDLGAALGPALIPIGAELIPLITTATADIGFLAAGAGVAVLAFHGLGTALTAFNKAAAQPTATNIAAAQVALDKLPPSAQAFIIELHRLNPELTALRQSAASGLFPGLDEGLHSLIQTGPLARRTVHGIALEMGSLGAEAGKAVSGPEGKAFLRYFGREAPLAIHQLGDATGFAADGVFRLIRDFTPLTHDVNGGILRLAKNFDDFTKSKGGKNDVESFIDYVKQNGPEVEQFLGDTGHLITDIVQAAAPLGGPTLRILDDLVKVLDAIASSPLATPLLALAQISSVLRLTQRGLGAVGIQSDLSLKGKVTANAKAASTALFGVTSAQDRARLSSKQLEEQQAKGRAAIAGGAVALAGFALASSGAADAMGLQNTTMLATTGLMLGGPWGAAVGGGVGLLMDFQAANKQAAQQVDELNSSVHGLAASGNITGLGQLATSAQKAIDAINPSGGPGGIGGKLAAEVSAPVTAFGTLGDAISAFNIRLTGSQAPTTKLADLQQVATRMQPAMTKLGLTFDDLLTMNSDQLNTTINRLAHMTAVADTTQGKTHAVADAFAAMGDQALTADQRVQGLTDSLDGLLDPAINLSQATDQYTTDLHKLASELDKSNKTLKGNSDAALQNRAAIRTRVTDLKGMIEAEANAGKSSTFMSNSLKRGRQALLDAGTAAGISRSDMQAYLDTLNLTPKFVRTVIQQVGAADVLGQIRRIKVGLDGLHSRTIVLRTQHDNVFTSGGHATPGSADGSTVPGPRTPYGDKVLRLVAPGEEIITNRHGEADRNRGLLKAINAGRFTGYADGGTVAGTSYAGPAASSQRVALGPLHMTLDLNTPWGTQTVHAVARQAASEVYAEERTADTDWERARNV